MRSNFGSNVKLATIARFQHGTYLVRHLQANRREELDVELSCNSQVPDHIKKHSHHVIEHGAYSPTVCDARSTPVPTIEYMLCGDAVAATPRLQLMTMGVVRTTADTPWVVRRERVAVECVSPFFKAAPPGRHERDLGLNLAFGIFLTGFRRFCHDEPTEAGFSSVDSSKTIPITERISFTGDLRFVKCRLSITTESAASCQTPR